MSILVFGGSGLLGSEVISSLRGHKLNYYAPNRADFNVRDAASVDKIFLSYRPDYVINCLAEKNINFCEENKEAANDTNSQFVLNLLLSSYKVHVKKFIQISTSNVFHDSKDFILTSEPPTPINYYGYSKQLAENFVKEFVDLGINYNILRFGWMYGHQKNNFVTEIIKKIKNKEQIEVIDDQFDIPVWNRDIANCILRIMENGPNNKILHFSSIPNQKISKMDIVAVIDDFFKAKSVIIPLSSGLFFKTKRSKNVCLQHSPECGPVNWRDSLIQFLTDYAKNNN